MSVRIVILILCICHFFYGVICLALSKTQMNKSLPEEMKACIDVNKYICYVKQKEKKARVVFAQDCINTLLYLFIIFSDLFLGIDKLGIGTHYTILLSGLIFTGLERCIAAFCGYYYLNKIERQDSYKIDERVGLFWKYFSSESICILLVNFLLPEIILLIKNNNFFDALSQDGRIYSFIYLFSILQIVTYIIKKISIFFQNYQIKHTFIFSKLTDGNLLTKLIDTFNLNLDEVDILKFDESRFSQMRKAIIVNGKRRAIALSDNLLNNASEEEIIAVVAHEMGHICDDTSINAFLMRTFINAVTAVTFSSFPIESIIGGMQEWVNTSFGLENTNYFLIFLLCYELSGPFLSAWNVLLNCSLRKKEYRADYYAVRYGCGMNLIQFLIEEGKINYESLNPHPFIEFVDRDHPSSYRRIRKIRQYLS